MEDHILKDVQIVLLEEVEKALKEEGIETLIYHIPNVPLQDCIACGSCAKTVNVFFDD